MCYNYNLKLNLGDDNQKQKLTSRFKASIQPSLFEKVNFPVYHASGFSHPNLPIVTAEQPDVIQPYQWGLIPFFVKDQLGAVKAWNSTLNCRSESMYDKASFKQSALKGKRCLIIATGFFEWYTLTEKQKFPFFFERKDQDVFSFAGLYDSWKNPQTGEVVNGHSMLTCKASPLLAKIHNAREEEDFRMPVILPEQFEQDWLNPNLIKEDVLALCQPYDDSLLNAHSVSKLITSRKENNNVPAVLEKYDYPELVNLF